MLTFTVFLCDSKYNLKGAVVCGSVLPIATYANIRNIFSDTRDDAIYDPLECSCFTLP